MKNIFHGLLIITPFAALVLFFSFTGREEVKAEQRLFQATQALEQQKFDDEFHDAWNGKPSLKTRRQRAETIAELKEEVAKEKAKRAGLDAMFDEAAGDMRDAIKEEDSRLAASAVQSVSSGGVK